MLRVPSDVQKRRLVILYSSLIRPPLSPYVNLNYSPPRSRYGFLTFHRNGYVVGEGAIEFDKQSFDTVADITSQNLIAIKCAYEGILQSYVNLAVGIGGTPGGVGMSVVSVTDLIKDYEYLDLAWDEVRVVCYADTALNLKLYALPHDTCDPLKDKPRKPPPPEPPPDPVPPGTPLTNLDPPYEDEENPDNFTEPFPGDESDPTPLPPTDECVGYNVAWVLFDSLINAEQSDTVPLFGEIDDYRVTLDVGEFKPPGNPFSDTVQFQIRCRGVNAAGNSCGELDWIRIYGQVGAETTLEVISVTVT